MNALKYLIHPLTLFLVLVLSLFYFLNGTFEVLITAIIIFGVIVLLFWVGAKISDVYLDWWKKL